MPSWTLRSSVGDTNSGVASPVTITLPTNVAGDLMVCDVVVYEGASQSVVTISGWTQISAPATRTATGTGNNRLTRFAKISTGAEASVQYAQTNQQYSEGMVAVFTPGTSAAALVANTPTNTPNPSIGHTATDNGTPILDASVSVGAVTDLYVLGFAGWSSEPGTWSPTALTRIFGSSIDGVCNMYYATDLASTTVGQEASTCGSQPWFILSSSFALAGGGGGPQDTPELYGRPRPSARQMVQLLAQ